MSSICYCRETFRRCKIFLNSCLRLSDIDVFLQIDEAERNGLIHLIAIFAITRSKDSVVFDQSRCFGCGICKEVCEVGAITLVRRGVE